MAESSATQEACHGIFFLNTLGRESQFRLTLRRKAALGLLALALLSIGTLVTFDRLVLPQRFDRVERLEVERDALRVVNALEVRGELLDVLLVDWAAWDDSYRFMDATDSEAADEYRSSNLVDDLLDALGLGALIFLDTDGELREALWRWPSGEATPIQGLEPDSEAVLSLSMEAEASGSSVGVIRMPVGHPMLAAARPITMSDSTGASHGTLIMALWLDDAFAAELSESLATPLRFETMTSEPDVVELASDVDAIAIVEDGELNGQALIRDTDGQPAFLVETSQRREIASLRDQALWLAIAGVVLTIGLTAMMIYAATEVLLLRPMLLMRHELAYLDAEAASGTRGAGRAGDDPGTGRSRLNARGHDEIAEVARAVNAMLDRLADSTAEQERLTIAVGEQEEVARTALLEMGEGFLAFDHGGRCQVCNPAAARMLKRSSEQVRGRHITELLPSARAPQSSDGPQIIEVSGRSLAITRSANLRGARSGRSVVVLRDVTDILDVERLKRDIIATVSHELRTPLTSIRATVELFQEGEGGALSEVQTRMLTLLSRNTDRLLHIVNDLLALTTLESGTVALRREECDLAVVAARVVEDLQPLAAASAIDLDVDVAESAVAWGDEPRIRQVIDNLVQNAIKFSPSGSRISLDVRTEADEVVVSVRDQGPGITRAEQERVFEKFYRSPGSERLPGTGLGLPIARLIVELHGGRIWIESDGATGTTVLFTVPAPP